MEKKKKVALGPVDILLILSAVCIVFFVIAMMAQSDASVLPATQTTKLFYTVELERKLDGFQDNIHVLS